MIIVVVLNHWSLLNVGQPKLTLEQRTQIARYVARHVRFPDQHVNAGHEQEKPGEKEIVVERFDRCRWQRTVKVVGQNCDRGVEFESGVVRYELHVVG